MRTLDRARRFVENTLERDEGFSFTPEQHTTLALALEDLFDRWQAELNDDTDELCSALTVALQDLKEARDELQRLQKAAGATPLRETKP